MSVLDQIARWPIGAGAAVLIAPEGDVARYGDDTAVYELASVTKLLVAAAALVGVEEGAIGLSDSAGPPGATVRHLLAHASGLGFDSDTVEADVGTQRIYSSRGYEILAEHIERATDIPFADYLHEAVAVPLGMSSMRLQGPAGHGVSASATDLAAFARHLLRPSLVSAPLHTEATHVQYPGLDGFVPGYGRHRPNDWGLGPELRGNKSPHWTGSDNSASTFGHFGQSGTFCWVDPELDAACVVLTDRPFGNWAKPLWSDFNNAVVDEIRQQQTSSR